MKKLIASLGFVLLLAGCAGSPQLTLLEAATLGNQAIEAAATSALRQYREGTIDRKALCTVHQWGTLANESFDGVIDSFVRDDPEAAEQYFAAAQAAVNRTSVAAAELIEQKCANPE